jgi:DNA-3-methyladenine glycosylase
MEERRAKAGAEVSNGPAKLCQALDIDRRWTGHDLEEQPIKLLLKPPLKAAAVVVTTRVGITKAREVPGRFYIRCNGYVSRP